MTNYCPRCGASWIYMPSNQNAIVEPTVEHITAIVAKEITP